MARNPNRQAAYRNLFGDQDMNAPCNVSGPAPSPIGEPRMDTDGYEVYQRRNPDRSPPGIIGDDDEYFIY